MGGLTHLGLNPSSGRCRGSEPNAPLSVEKQETPSGAMNVETGLPFASLPGLGEDELPGFSAEECPEERGRRTVSVGPATPAGPEPPACTVCYYLYLEDQEVNGSGVFVCDLSLASGVVPALIGDNGNPRFAGLTHLPIISWSRSD